MILFYNHNDPFYELSNFYPYNCGKKHNKHNFNLVYKKQIWPTSEHLYQALKFKWETTEELEWKEYIRTSNTPTIAKYLGHQFTHRQWKWQQKYYNLVQKYKDKIRYSGDIKSNKYRYKIMKKVCKIKFSQNPYVKQILKNTNCILGENCSSFWGYGGKNALGRILMHIRDKL